MNKLISIFIFAILLSNCKEKETVAAKTSNPLEYSMDHYASLFLENPELNSISIGLYKDGETFQKFYGEIDKGKGNLPNANSIFELASVTKTFTAFLAAKAVLEGKITLEDDISMHLDGTFDNLEFEGRPIKIKDLLTHTSGLTRDATKTLSLVFSSTANEEEKATLAAYNRESLMGDLKQVELDTIPGSRYDYSPFVGPELLATILEKVYQKSYQEMLQQEIFDKAEMVETSMLVKAADQKNFMNGYSDEGELAEPMPLIMSGAGGGLKSTIPDVLKYIKFLLESKSPEIEEMQRHLFFDEEEGDAYGYFWDIGEGEFMHKGGTGGSTIWVFLLPEDNAGFTVVFNSNGDSSEWLSNRIAGRIKDDIEIYPKKNIYFAMRKALLANTESGIEYYHQFKKDSLVQFDFDDSQMLNRIGYELLREEKFSEGIKVFQLLVSEFPDSANPYDSLGEGYLLNEQYDLALMNYKKSLELNPESENAKHMIEEIERAQNNQ